MANLAHFHHIPSIVEVLFPMEPKFIFNEDNIIQIGNLYLQICLVDINLDFGSGYDIFRYLILNGQFVVAKVDIFTNGIGKIRLKYVLGSVPKTDHTIP